ncbi:MAG: nucleotidyl transferase AbiEii/AbiGii toxin family protein [Phocaeicola sp.]|uniref:nucleotidyl transferase AbiEii/AbiGii toxin family protein n=1 Tax=Phocaeicola TaxID=909656 RepID=UPI00234F2148|nr:nucleotidyl transferase AbiEii/AbiGii toxin family protein [Phocaeicola oris]MCE2615594.1 nucleotidyl transferase AbiEii/AbiGii toxin family protein [Phocaeicola oris]
MSIWQDKTIDERIAIVQKTAEKTNIEDLAIEKDWWVTITLKALFSTSFSKFLFFKGGTSLSKGKWENIDLQRFSEDIDISLSRKWFTETEEKQKLYPFAKCENNNQLKSLRKASRKVIFEKLSPKLKEQLINIGAKDFYVENVKSVMQGGIEIPIDTDRDPVVLNIVYPSILDEKNEYVQPKVKIEISCMSMDEPFENRALTSLIYDTFNDVDDATKCVIPMVLPIRTFLEKALLLNEEYQKKSPRSERMSRHLYDLERLMDTYSETAINDAELYKSIIEHRKKFYHVSSVDYDSDKRENIKIWPTGETESLFRDDYKAMIESFIYNENPLSFEQLKKRILSLEAKFREDQ